MANVLSILIIYLARISFGQEGSFSSQEYYKLKDVLEFKNNCNSTWRMISDDDVTNPKQELLEHFKDNVWINVTVRYTPWVIDRGSFNHNLLPQDIFAESNITNSKTKFIDCCRFCSKYEWSYIGLQGKKCYCLSSSALENARSYSVHISKPCVEENIPQCPEIEIAVYEKDTYTYQGLKECLFAKFVNNTPLSISSTSCKAKETFALCVNKAITEYRAGGLVASRHQMVGYCKHHESLNDVDFKTINSTKTAVMALTDGNYWLNNFRESYVLKPVMARHNGLHCTTARSINGRIQLQSADCYSKAYTLCIKDSGYTSISTHDSTLTVTMSTEVSPNDPIIKQRISASGQTSVLTYHATSTVTTGHGTDFRPKTTAEKILNFDNDALGQTSVPPNHTTSTAITGHVTDFHRKTTAEKIPNFGNDASGQISVTTNRTPSTVKTGHSTNFSQKTTGQTLVSTHHATSTVIRTSSGQTSVFTHHATSTATGSVSGQTSVSSHRTTSTMVKDFNQTTPAEMIPDIRFEFSTIMIIIGAAGFLLILIVLIGVVVLIRYRKQRKPSTPLGPVYATVLKEMIQKANVINHGLPPEVKHDTIEDDNTYDHTTFMTRHPFQLGDVSNYDTMENMQETGEYNFQHMVTFKKSTCVAEIVDSVYNHTSDFPPPPNMMMIQCNTN